MREQVTSRPLGEGKTTLSSQKGIPYPLAALTFLGCKVLPSGLPREQTALCTQPQQQQLLAPQQHLTAGTGPKADDGRVTSLHQSGLACGAATCTGDSPNEGALPPTHGLPLPSGAADLRGWREPRHPQALAVGRGRQARRPQEERPRGKRSRTGPQRLPPRAPAPGPAPPTSQHPGSCQPPRCRRPLRVSGRRRGREEVAKMAATVGRAGSFGSSSSGLGSAAGFSSPSSAGTATTNNNAELRAGGDEDDGQNLW